MSNGKSNGETESNLVVCPNSEARCWEAAEDYKLHYANREEIAAHGGVCKSCCEKFKKFNGSAFKHAPETPVEMSPAFHVLSVDQDHAGYTTPGEAEQIVEFNWGEVDEAFGVIESAPENVRADAAALFRELMAWVWSGDRISIRLASVRFAALTAGLMPGLIQNFTYEEIGQQAGVTKANVSKIAKNFEASFNFRFSRSRSSESVEHMRRAAIKSHASRRAERSDRAHKDS